VVFLGFCVGAGGGYALGQAIGLGFNGSTILGWILGPLLAFLVWRWKSYRAAFRVERYRAAAQELRRTDPDTYEEILAHAYGSPAEQAAMSDPDAYVALFLREAERAGLVSGTPQPN
jgi:hypothetical protein